MDDKTREIERILLEAQEADIRAVWATAAIIDDTRVLEARNAQIIEQLNSKQGNDT